jgi:hypothetical protein
VLFWRAHCAASPLVKAPSSKKKNTPVGLATAGGLAEIAAGVMGTAATRVDAGRVDRQ